MERAKTSGRKDDNMESLIKRLKTFNGESIPVVEMFEKTRPGFVVRINALQSIDKVFSDIEDSLKLKELPLTAETRPVLYAW
jgi:adenylate kinase family enzyme